MHFYDFNIGEYAKKTQHLTNEEDLAYRRLLDMYYDTEKPIANPSLNGGLATLSRRLRVSEQALKNVLDEFFPGGINKHAEEKIAAYYAYIAKQASNGKLGGRPKRTQAKPTANPPLTHRKPSAKPTLTTNHLPLPKEKTNTLSGLPDSLSPKIPKPKVNDAETAEVISYLNERAGTNFKQVEANAKLIAARLKDGATVDECKRVVDFKVSEWGRDSKMREYLRPATLFNAEKFAQYVGQLAVKAQPAERPFVC